MGFVCRYLSTSSPVTPVLHCRLHQTPQFRLFFAPNNYDNRSYLYLSLVPGFHGELEHLMIKMRLIDEIFASGIDQLFRQELLSFHDQFWDERW